MKRERQLSTHLEDGKKGRPSNSQENPHLVNDLQQQLLQHQQHQLQQQEQQQEIQQPSPEFRWNMPGQYMPPPSDVQMQMIHYAALQSCLQQGLYCQPALLLQENPSFFSYPSHDDPNAHQINRSICMRPQQIDVQEIIDIADHTPSPSPNPPPISPNKEESNVDNTGHYENGTFIPTEISKHNDAKSNSLPSPQSVMPVEYPSPAQSPIQPIEHVNNGIMYSPKEPPQEMNYYADLASTEVINSITFPAGRVADLMKKHHQTKIPYVKDSSSLSLISAAENNSSKVILTSNEQCLSSPYTSSLPNPPPNSPFLHAFHESHSQANDSDTALHPGFASDNIRNFQKQTHGTDITLSEDKEESETNRLIEQPSIEHDSEIELISSSRIANHENFVETSPAFQTNIDINNPISSNDNEYIEEIAILGEFEPENVGNKENLVKNKSKKYDEINYEKNPQNKILISDLSAEDINGNDRIICERTAEDNEQRKSFQNKKHYSEKKLREVGKEDESEESIEKNTFMFKPYLQPFNSKQNEAKNDETYHIQQGSNSIILPYANAQDETIESKHRCLEGIESGNGFAISLTSATGKGIASMTLSPSCSLISNDNGEDKQGCFHEFLVSPNKLKVESQITKLKSKESQIECCKVANNKASQFHEDYPEVMDLSCKANKTRSPTSLVLPKSSNEMYVDSVRERCSEMAPVHSKVPIIIDLTEKTSLNTLHILSNYKPYATNVQYENKHEHAYHKPDDKPILHNQPDMKPISSHQLNVNSNQCQQKSDKIHHMPNANESLALSPISSAFSVEVSPAEDSLIAVAGASGISNPPVDERTPIGDYPIICDGCGKEFSDRPNLSAHRCVPSDVRQYPCTRGCGRPFKNKSDRFVHVVTEVCIRIARRLNRLDDGRWQCNICNFIMEREKRAKNHAKQHESGLGYKCSECGEVFKWQKGYVLAKHIRDRHPEYLERHGL